MKLDIKSIAILTLTVICILLFAMWYFKSSDTKGRLKQLESENLIIEKVKDSLDIVNKKLLIEFDKIQKSINDRDNKIKEIEEKLLKYKKELEIANYKINSYKKDLAETKKKIDKLKKEPIKRNDEDLINSLKEKLK